jgi:uncharacterized membrane protein HdeD (DUF308 family)
MSTTVSGELRRALGWSMAAGVLMIVAGILAIALPFAIALFTAALLGWIVLFGGVAQLFYAFQSRHQGGFALKLVVGLLYLATGLMLLWNPVSGAVSLTLLLGAFLVVEGLLEAFLGGSLRPLPGSGWLILDGLVTLVLGILILAHWPSDALWVLGTLVGISLVSSGITRLLLASTARAALPAAA